jgi:hypothetical protein
MKVAQLDTIRCTTAVDVAEMVLTGTAVNTSMVNTVRPEMARPEMVLPRMDSDRVGLVN